jgi:hypothetical protein
VGLCIVTALIILLKAFEREGQLEHLEQERRIIDNGGNYAVESSHLFSSCSNVRVIQ